MASISSSIQKYLEMVRLSRSLNTFLTYRKAMEHLSRVLTGHGLDIEKLDISALTEDVVSWTIRSLQYHAASSERLHLTALIGYFEYLSAENLTTINAQKVRLLIKQRARKPGIRLPQFPKDAISQLLEKMESLTVTESMDDAEKLRLLRDRAFLITLGETGLRVHEACKLTLGDMDWTEGRAIVIGKGNREAVVRFSRRSEKAIIEYLKLRAPHDKKSGRAIGPLPLFARHDKGSGKSTKPMTPTTGRNIVDYWVREILGEDAAGTITPHSFRHYFVTRVLQSSGNLKLGQELARHKNIAVTQRYAHLSDDELDKGYWDVFEKKS
jgi:site-specific recombinase XerD